ncbi:hypothetical protein ABKV19_017105 [Rosa sericea]
MAIVLRYVNKGQVIERFVGVKHVTDTTSASLKAAIDQFFSENGLSISSLRGQGYDGASNMRGEFNGLKALILKENGSAFYVHCFAHQLQLAIVAVAKNHILISNLFMFVGSLVNVAGSSCKRHIEIDVPNMDGVPFIPRKSRRRAPKVTNLHRYRVELFCAVIDMQLQELNDHFTETTTKLLLLSLLALEDELDTYISDMRSNSVFTQLKGISDLGEKMVETQKDKVYPLVYLLITLTLILPVATATVERAFSAMKIIKSDLRNRMGDMWMNGSMITYIEKEIFDGIDNETIMKRFQNMSNRRGQL